MRRIRGLWPFTCLGLLTFLFLAVEAEFMGADVLGGLLRILIIPLWLMRYVVVAIGLQIFGPDRFPGWFNIITIPLLLMPYIALDLILYGLRRGVRRVVPSA